LKYYLPVRKILAKCKEHKVLEGLRAHGGRCLDIPSKKFYTAPGKEAFGK